MATSFRLEIEPLSHGWVTVRLTTPGVNLAFTASYIQDSISGLARAADGLLAGVSDHTVTWNTEPVEYDFRFVMAGGRTRLEVHEFPDRRRRWRRVEVPLAVVEEETTSIGRALWRGLRRLQGAMSAEEFEVCWRHPFPTAIVERLGAQLRTCRDSETE
jgi:hypothetical protein